MNTSNPIFIDEHQATVRISVAEFENLMACKRELMATKEVLKQMLGDDL